VSFFHRAHPLSQEDLRASRLTGLTAIFCECCRANDSWGGYHQGTRRRIPVVAQ